jgi:hypothetical protein
MGLEVALTVAQSAGKVLLRERVQTLHDYHKWPFEAVKALTSSGAGFTEEQCNLCYDVRARIDVALEGVLKDPANATYISGEWRKKLEEVQKNMKTILRIMKDARFVERYRRKLDELEAKE